jgi:ketosteroid isomerase-like protein
MFKHLYIFCLTMTLTLPVFALPLQQEVQSSLQSGVEAWNRGDLETFMKGYVQGADLTYTAGGKVVRGSDALFQRYQTTYGENKESMGQLRFEEIETWPLGPDHALAMGRWILELRAKPTVQGIFSLVLRRGPDGWLILHDHTSRLDPAKK